MKIILKTLLILVVLISCYYFTGKHTVLYSKPDIVNAQEINKELTIQEIVDKVSKEYNQDSWLIYNVCYAESHFNPGAVHDGGRGKGVCGIHKTTFIGWEKEFNVDLNYDSTYDQIKMTVIAFSKGEKYRDDWSTYNRYVKYGVFNKYEIK